jgi:CDP-paratose 2-epimerase
MNIVLITGASGLIGNESVNFFSNKFDLVIGIDNDMRKYFFGDDASIIKNTDFNIKNIKNYIHFNIDIRNYDDLNKIFNLYNNDIKLIIHTAAQPSHDWSINDPLIDYNINANGTLNLLELTRKYCKNAIFIYTSTNKVYGDNPNKLPLIEKEKRWEIIDNHEFYNGITEKMSIDNTKHSLFGVSKLSADLMCQEYGKYFNIKTGIFRCGCLTGPKHKGVEQHGFLSYLIKTYLLNKQYKIYGYKGKQVRDNIHSYDLINIFWNFYTKPLYGEIFNIGGGRENSCSILEIFDILDNKINNKNKNKYIYINENRIGDHIWYISDIKKYKNIYNNFKIKYNLNDIIDDIIKNIEI